MTERVLGPTGSPRRRWTLLLPLVVMVALGLFYVAGAQAVHDETFQLDGNTALGNDTNFGGNTQSIDWASLFDASGAELSLPTGFDATSFKKDFINNGSTFVTSDTTTYATGSKDTLPISGWQCNFDNNVNSKIDVMNAYAASYTDPTGDEILYFGLERNSNSGTADVGFWFLQDNVGCTSTGGAVTFTGEHKDGDLLVVSEFTGGGTVSTINVYRWDRPGNPPGVPGSLRTTPVASGADCRGANVPTDDEACGAANTGTITVPWLSAVKGAGPTQVTSTLPTALFFEGGVNLTDSNLGGKCFNTFLADTRSSAELTATLFDFTGDTLGACTSDVDTTPVDNAGTPIPAGGLTIPGDPDPASILVKDSAVLNVTGASSFTATIKYYLCGPFAVDATTRCETGGVLVETKNVTANGTYVSSAATVTSAGRYCWRADFSGDSGAGVPSGSDSAETECFKVNPRKATLSTTAGADVDLGNPVTDTATLGNTAHKPGTGGPDPDDSTNGSINPTTLGGDATGTITFTLYKADCTTLATGTGDNPQTVTLTAAAGGNGTYGPVSFTPDAPGTYHWVASYSGDLPNTQASDASACLEPSEEVVVNQVETQIKTKQSWYPNDTATVTADQGNLAAGGKVKFELFTNATCSGSAAYTEEVTLTGGASTEEVNTTNPTQSNSYKITTNYTDGAGSSITKHSWRVTYTPAVADTGHRGSRSTCDSENFTITYKNDAGPGIDFP